MPGNFTLKRSATIKAPVDKVWKAITTQELLKKIYFDFDWITDWKKGSPIFIHGIWDRQPFIDKGNVLDIEEEKFILYNYWISDSGKADLPENYTTVRYELSSGNNETIFTIYEYGFETETTVAQSYSKWDNVLYQLKEVAEKL